MSGRAQEWEQKVTEFYQAALEALEVGWARPPHTSPQLGMRFGISLLSRFCYLIFKNLLEYTQVKKKSQGF